MKKRKQNSRGIVISIIILGILALAAYAYAKGRLSLDFFSSFAAEPCANVTLNVSPGMVSSVSGLPATVKVHIRRNNTSTNNTERCSGTLIITPPGMTNVWRIDKNSQLFIFKKLETEQNITVIITPKQAVLSGAYSFVITSGIAQPARFIYIVPVTADLSISPTSHLSQGLTNKLYYQYSPVNAFCQLINTAGSQHITGGKDMSVGGPIPLHYMIGVIDKAVRGINTLSCTVNGTTATSTVNVITANAAITAADPKTGKTGIAFRDGDKVQITWQSQGADSCNVYAIDPATGAHLPSFGSTPNGSVQVLIGSSNLHAVTSEVHADCSVGGVVAANAVTKVYIVGSSGSSSSGGSSSTSSNVSSGCANSNLIGAPAVSWNATTRIFTVTRCPSSDSGLTFDASAYDNATYTWHQYAFNAQTVSAYVASSMRAPVTIVAHPASTLLRSWTVNLYFDGCLIYNNGSGSSNIAIGSCQNHPH